MKSAVFIFVFILIAEILLAQKPVVNEYAAIDKKALQLPDSSTKTTDGIANYVTANFATNKDKTRAIFIWITSNIEYDIQNMFALNFYEQKEDKIAKPLKNRKGTCENYAALFTDVCLKTGIKAYMIEGYTKQNGFADYLSHAWCAAFIDSAWCMFDPTWGSGYGSAGKFYKKINNAYFKAAPATLIKSHIPFDYLWQFLNYPITNQEFYEGKTLENKSKPYFDYSDSIKVYEKQDHIAQLVSSSCRIEKNGVRNSLVFDRLQHIKLELEMDRQNKAINLYNGAVASYNEGVNLFNDFIQYRNKQFVPMKTDSAIQNMIDTVTAQLSQAKLKLNQIANPDANTIALISQLNKSMADISVNIKEQQEWLTLYFSKGKSKRKSMFYEKKYSLFGIPLN